MSIPALIARIYRRQPFRFTLSVVALAIAGLLEGFALASVVPLLQMAQGGTEVVATGRLGGAIESVLSALHLPFDLATVLVFIFGLVLASQLVILAQQRLVSGSAAKFEQELRQELYSSITWADWPYFVEHKASDLAAGLMHETVRAGDSYRYLVQLLGTVIMVAVYLGLALVLSWQMTLVMGVMGALVLFVLRARVAKGTQYGREITEMAFEMWPEVQEHIAAAKTVKAYNVEPDTVERFSNLTARFASIQFKSSMNQAWLRFSYESISSLAVFLGIYVAVSYYHMSMSFLVVFLLLFYRVSPRISGVQSMQTQVLALSPGVVTVDRMIAEAQAARERSGSVPLAAVTEGIALEHVTFEYANEALVLHDVSFEIPIANTVAIVGPSGSGKTTIVDLLLGVLSPTFGAIRVDGEDLAQLDLKSWRARIGYVAQDSSFFHDTVRQNIRFGCPDASDAEVAEAARLAFADAFIGRLPEGYDTIIGDRGVRLSGGQRQRLALARAIVRKPDILVLDEATSALDAESEEKIQRAVDMLAKQMTIVIVTHRLATVRNADIIHFLENGSLIESGSWEQLVANDGRFSEMQAMQQLT